ncbi:DUF3857 domain-containing protein [Myroides marinus]|uniref:DUF3857 domain-containing protein n=1 Tax=Myroides marinus TaxID=703342 RepID=UPI00257865DE|nr:DUF3857 domain-containing protein [Myroides marinus]MDM1532427.1 DUF3857 domain-containing protein [Myroides marinus]MDM1539389.1 DUF3857 domain-containing protein [Myroides marinus]
MNRLFTIILSVFLLLLTPIYAQDFLGKVKVEELAELSNTSFPKAKAVVLNEETIIEFEYSMDYGFRVNEIVHRKVKLYDVAAKEQLKFVVAYASKGYSREDVVIEVSNIYRLINGQIVKEKSKKESLIDTDKGNWREKGVSYNDAKAGDIIEYSYTKSTNYIDELPEWYIQSDIPKEKTSYRVTVPEYFLYSIIQKGRIKPTDKEANARISFRGMNGGFGRTEVNAIQKEFTAQLVPAYEVEPYMSNPSNYISTVRFDLQQVQMPYSSPEKIMQTEKEYFVDLLKSRGFGKELKQDKFLKKELNIEEYKGLTQEQRVNKVLSIVQNRVKWNNEYSIYINNGIKPTYYKGDGNSADINLLLVAMLRNVEVKANPVLLSTRSNGEKIVWQRNYYNHVIAAVELDNQIYLLDATNPYTALNILPPEDLNGEGSILYDNGIVSNVNLMPRFVSALNKKITMIPNASGTINGQIIENHNNYEALNFRNMYDGSEWRLGKWFESQNYGVTVNESKVYDSKDNTKDVRVVYAYTRANGAIVFNNKIFVKPFQFYPLLENPFTQEERLTPIYIGYPELDNYQVAINIPDGYKVSELPQGFTKKSIQSGIELQTKFELKDNQVLCTLIFIKGKGVIDPKEYQEVKEIFNDLINQLQVQVELEKK